MKSGAMHLAPAPDVKELSNFLHLERSGIQVCENGTSLLEKFCHEAGRGARPIVPYRHGPHGAFIKEQNSG